MNIDEQFKSTFAALDNVLSNVNLENVSADNNGGFDELPEGWYLAEIEKAELTVSKSSGNPMVSMTLKIVEDGQLAIFDSNNSCTLTQLSGTKNRKMFKHFVLSTDRQIKSFISDMLKIEDSDGQPLLDKDCFASSELISDTLDAIIGMRIYVEARLSNNKQMWYNFVSWKTAHLMGLPE